MEGESPTQPRAPARVFLSYASQDGEAAQKICAALRAAGIGVFLDQSELRGGDAWDQKIRHEIHDCALFIPIVSQHTQERLEGYFRHEWKLAIERTHHMAEQKPFLVPVVVDGTREHRRRYASCICRTDKAPAVDRSVKTDPVFAGLRGDPRYKAVLRKMNLTE